MSDVKLLKAGCLKFQAEFDGHAEFKLMEKCVTIASACNRFWHKNMLLARCSNQPISQSLQLVGVARVSFKSECSRFFDQQANS